MLQITGHRHSRRALLTAACGFALAAPLARANPQPARRGRVRSVILIDLYGGPSHLDMFDPKPDAPAEIRGEFNTIRTALPGVLVSEHLPQISRWLDHVFDLPVASL